MSIYLCCTTIFCDDVRQEINGKMSLMGMYGDRMFVPVFPITLPKICSFFDLRVKPRVENNTEAVISIMKGADKIGGVTVPIPSSDDIAKVPHGKPLVYSRLAGALEFPSMTFTEPTLLELLVQIDGETNVGGRIWVSEFPQQEDTEKELVAASEDK